MSDILDVMNIKSFPQKKKNEKEPTPFQPQQTFSEARQIYAPEEHASQNKRRKLSAMNRELYNLIGSNVPPLAIDTASVSNAGGSKKFKDKLVNSKKNAHWRNLGFKNSARNDGLVLHHWTKSKLQSVESKESSETPVDDKTEGAAKSDTTKIEEELDPQEYRYAKYNTKLDIPTFTEDEYNEAVKTEENNIRKELELKQAKEKIKQEKIESEKNPETKEPVEKLEENKVEKNDQTENPEKLQSVEAQGSNNPDKQEEKNTEVEKGLASDSNKDSKDPAPQESKIDNKKEEKPSGETKERPWTYEETKYLFDLCSDLDMRWAVIFDTYQDRYSDRTLEDLKVQMYSISASLLEKRGNPNDSALIKALRSFNKEKEISRKFYLTKLIHRAPTEIAEEESLVIEARKFELAAKKMLYERGQLLQLLDSPQSSASVQQYLTSQGLTQLYNSLMASDKGKKRKAEVPVAPLLGPNAIPHTQHISMSNSSNSSNNNMTNMNSNNKRRANAAAAAAAAASSTTTVASVSTPKPANNSNTNKNPSKLTEVQQLLQKSLTPEELEIYGIEIHNDRLQPGVHVRSQKIASFKPSVQAKVHEILGQLGLSVKPNVPTGPVSKKFDELLYKISHLVDLKKQSDKLLAEIELIKRQKGVL
jgi:DNA methyltransferase 1-associated protein 1